MVTATDTYVADVAIANGKITAIGKDLPVENATQFWMLRTNWCCPAASTYTRISICHSEEPRVQMILRPVRGPRLSAARPRSSISRFNTKVNLAQAFDTWMSKASSKAVCDYAFHCIMTDVSGGQLAEMNDLVREGVTSFKLFMAYPGVFMLDDGSIFKALRRTSKNGGLVCMHAENGSAIDVIVQQALAEGKKAPKYHALTRPTTAEAEATAARLRWRRWPVLQFTSCI